MILSFLHHYREFIETHYVPVKQSNPNFPILIRECSDIQPRVWARYGKCNFGNLLALAILEVYIKIDSVVCRMFWRNEAIYMTMPQEITHVDLNKTIIHVQLTVNSNTCYAPYFAGMHGYKNQVARGKYSSGLNAILSIFINFNGLISCSFVARFHDLITTYIVL